MGPPAQGLFASEPLKRGGNPLQRLGRRGIFKPKGELRWSLLRAFEEKNFTSLEHFLK